MSLSFSFSQTQINKRKKERKKMKSLLSKSNLVQASIITIWLLLFFPSSEAYTNNNGNITIKWDLYTWTPNGYVAVVTINNYQKDRSISHPGWTVGWTWTQNELIWSMLGAETKEKGDCSSFKQNIPHSCVKNPRVVDLSPNAPFNHQIANCCRSGVLKSESASAFQLSVGNSGTTVETVRMPEKFVFLAPKQEYVCGPTRNAKPTVFISGDRRRKTKALMTWNVVCVFYKET